jgi:hypothetical protein
MASADRSFILNVLNGMGSRNEQWVRQQFHNYTRAFLDGIRSDTLKASEHKQLAVKVRTSPMYERYRTSLKGHEEAKADSNKVALSVLADVPL